MQPETLVALNVDVVGCRKWNIAACDEVPDQCCSFLCMDLLLHQCHLVPIQIFELIIASHILKMMNCKNLTHSCRYWSLLPEALRPVRSSSNSTPKEYTSAFSVISPLSLYSGAKYLCMCMCMQDQRKSSLSKTS